MKLGDHRRVAAKSSSNRIFPRGARSAERFPSWNEENCPETNNHVVVGKEDYMISWDGYLMPTKKGQKAPDLRYFK